MNRLHEKGWITDPKKKAKSVGVTEAGFEKAEAVFLKHFGKPER
jgi:Mn-dependent DtxR family transcriptional regulator